MLPHPIDLPRITRIALFSAVALASLLSGGPSWADVPLAARSADPEGWWKGRLYARAPSSTVLAVFTPTIPTLGVGGMVIEPMRLDERGDVLDHLEIDPRRGTAADLDAVIGMAHMTGVAVLIELSLNEVSPQHPWFVAAESGDRLAQDAFVWSDRALSAEHWTESAKVGRWYYHANSGPNLDLRHRLTRARVVQAARTWIDRGADGLVLKDAQNLFEGGASAESIDLVREIAEAVRASGAVVGVEVDGDAAMARAFLPAAAFAIHTSDAMGGAPPPGTRLVPGLTDDSSLLYGDPLLVPLGFAPAPLAVRRASAALSSGATTPIGGAAWVRQLGRERVLVASAPATVDLRAVGTDVRLETLMGGVPAKRGKKIALPSAGAWRLDGPSSPIIVRFGRLEPVARGVHVDLGLRFDEARGIGFSRDIERSTRCTKRRCTVGDDGPPVSWHLTLPSGPYEVELDGDERASMLAEGLPMRPHRKMLRASVFVRDGQLTLEAAQPGFEWSEIRVSPARFRAETPTVVADKDRVLLRALGPGVVEWRMNGSRVEPVENAPLVRRGERWEATLGPWPPGAVQDIAWVIRSAEGTFVTGEGGRELTLSIP